MISKIRGEVTNTIGKVIFNFNIIEEKVNSILTNYFEISREKEEFFRTQFLNTSIINFNSKIKLLKQIFEEIEYEFTKETIKLLEDINRYRNVFAHCKIEFEQVFPKTMSKEEKENLNDSSKSQLSNIYMEMNFIKPTLKHSMNAQGKVSDKEFFTIYEEFKEKVLEVETKLEETQRLIQKTN
ncbi:MAG: hypothetical protein LAT82_00195 [Nanoarchaeota archaeon]|nr:hypothetical protein [Nanoarchaeota archaeon]